MPKIDLDKEYGPHDFGEEGVGFCKHGCMCWIAEDGHFGGPLDFAGPDGECPGNPKDGNFLGKYGLDHECVLRRYIRELQVAANTNPITGLPNKRAMKERRKKVSQETENEPWIVLFIDVDDCKSINGKLGHDATDQMFGWLGRLISEKIRTGKDTCYHTGGDGGDEFVVFLSNLSKGQAEKRVRGIRARLRKEQFRPRNSSGEYRGDAISVDVSIGMESSKTFPTQDIVDAAEADMQPEKYDKRAKRQM